MQTRNDNRPPGSSRLARLAGIGVVAIGLVGVSAVTAEAATTCKSQAAEKETAEDYCRPILKCEEKNPPEEMNCTGSSTARRWICKCRKPKSTSGKPKAGFSIQFGFGIGPGAGGHPKDDDPKHGTGITEGR